MPEELPLNSLIPFPLKDTDDLPSLVWEWFVGKDQAIFTCKDEEKFKTYDSSLETIATQIEKELVEGKIFDPHYFEAIWLFYHHSAQINWLYLDNKESAKIKIAKALVYSQKWHGQKHEVTQILFYIYNGQPNEAKKYFAENQKSDLREAMEGTLKFYRIV